MKTPTSNFAKFAGTAFLIAVFATGFTAASAQTTKVALASETVQQLPSLDVAVYQVENSLKFKVHFENHAGKYVTVQIRNGANQVVYEEKVKKSPKYIRKFDLSTLPDGAYSFVVSNDQDSYRKDVNLQTLTARTLAIEE